MSYIRCSSKRRVVFGPIEAHSSQPVRDALAEGLLVGRAEPET